MNICALEFYREFVLSYYGPHSSPLADIKLEIREMAAMDGFET